MALKELAEAEFPSETFGAVTFDGETLEVGIQYGNLLVSIPKEDLPPLIEMLERAHAKLLK